MRVLVTRPQPDADKTAERLKALGHDPLVCSQFRLAPTGAEIDSEGAAALIVTSRNAVGLLATDQIDLIKAIPVYAVGKATADVCRNLGFETVFDAGGDSSDLVDLIMKAFPKSAGRLLHLCGVHVLPAVSERLQAEGYDLRQIVTYESVESGGFDAQARQSFEGGAVDGVLIYSSRAASAFLLNFAALGPATHKPVVVAISDRAAGPFAEQGGWRIITATHPDEKHLFSAIPDKSGD